MGRRYKNEISKRKEVITYHVRYVKSGEPPKYMDFVGDRRGMDRFVEDKQNDGYDVEVHKSRVNEKA